MRYLQFLGAASVLVAPCAAAAEPAEVADQADSILASAYSPDQPGAAAIVMRGGKVIWSGARGLADVEAAKPITPQTVFRTGSITKQIVAATVLDLVAQGRLSLDDPLAKFFPDWERPGARATVRQLLNHSSGIYDFSKIPGYMMSEPSLRPNTTADLLAVIRSQPSRAEPGTAWEYNNGGYVILGAIIERVTGRAWHEVAVERIGRPLGLASLAYAAAADERQTAKPYGAQGGKPVPASGVHISVAHAAGGLVMSVEDMAKWAKALHGGKVLPAALYQEMVSPARLADGSTRPYGFGLRLQEVRGHRALIHGGAGRGVDTGSGYIPDADVFVAVFSNSDELAADAGLVTMRLAALAVGQPIPTFEPAEVPLAQIEPLFGTYQVANGPEVTFFERGGELFMRMGDEERPLRAAGGNRFYFSDSGLMSLSITPGADGAHAMLIDAPDEAEPLRATRTGGVQAEVALAPEILASYAGTYATEGPVVTVSVAPNGWLTIAPAGQEGVPLRPVSETEFRADAAGFRVVFHPEDGVTDTLTMYRGARELHGRRTAP